MEEFDKIIERLDEIERYSGIWGVIIVLSIAVSLILLWIFLTKSIEKKAEQSFNRSLEKFKNGLYEKLGTELIKQQGEISREITEYKSELDKDISKLSADLQISIASQVEYKNAERNSIIEFLDSYSEWVYGGLEIQILDYKYQNFEDINNKLKEINEAFSKTNIAQNKLRFWVKNEDLIVKSHELVSSLLKLSHYTQSKLGSLRHNLSWGKIYTDAFQKILPNFENHKHWAEFLASEDKRIREENDALYKEYWDGKSELFREVIAVNKKFQDLAKEYLNQIEEKADT